MRPLLFTDALTVIGRVTEGDCGDPVDRRRGMAGVRLLLEDGTFVVTDRDGLYHFEGVRPGRHVVQLDTAQHPRDATRRSPATPTRAPARERDLALRRGAGRAAEARRFPAAPDRQGRRRRRRAADRGRRRCRRRGQPRLAGRRRPPGRRLAVPRRRPQSARARAARRRSSTLPGQRVALTHQRRARPMRWPSTAPTRRARSRCRSWTGLPLVRRRQPAGRARADRRRRRSSRTLDAHRPLRRRAGVRATIDAAQEPARRRRPDPAADRGARDRRRRPAGARRHAGARSASTSRIAPRSTPTASSAASSPDASAPTRSRGSSATTATPSSPLAADDPGRRGARRRPPRRGRGRRGPASCVPGSPRARAGLDWSSASAPGTIGYDTLQAPRRARCRAAAARDVVTDGQLALYAKGRIKGSWLLTLAYDSDRRYDPRPRAARHDRSRSLLHRLRRRHAAGL